MEIRTRFAPSPTGCLHVGAIRTALYSWLHARCNKGKFILRIEDTDLKRFSRKSINDIISTMNWLNLDWDEGPYFQTKRFDRYNTVIMELLKSGAAYKCFCSKERLEKLREIQIIKREKPHYDGHCYQKENNDCMNKSYAVRFRNPQEGFVIFNDQIRGPIKIKNKELDDLVIRRTNGIPTYNFCVAVDDWDMGITHVIRGEEHISNTPRQINILKAIGAKIPIYAHVSVILNGDGKKLSKRNSEKGVMEYRDNGFFPEALLNHLVRLGWSYGNQEIFSILELKKKFDLKSINASPTFLNPKKLAWLNWKYMNILSLEDIIKHLKWHIEQKKIDVSVGPPLLKVVDLLKSRCKNLKEMVLSIRYFYQEFNEFNSDSAKKYLSSISENILKILRKNLICFEYDWVIKNIYYAIQYSADELKLDIGKVTMPLRVAITGESYSPAIDAVLELIGYSRVIFRIERALQFISENKKFDINKRLCDY